MTVPVSFMAWGRTPRSSGTPFPAVQGVLPTAFQASLPNYQLVVV